MDVDEAQPRVASRILPKKVVSTVGLSDSFGQLRPGTEFQRVTEKIGGDDGTRTRGLCRDRAAF